MPLLLAAAAALLIQPECSWNRPGRDPYRGDAVAALERYKDIPRADRDHIAARLAAGTPDDAVRIGRETITGRYRYRAEIRDMHFGGASGGSARLCRTVDRSGWQPDHAEPADVYCSGDHCIVVPRVCGNVSRIERVGPQVPVTVQITLPPAAPPVPAPHPLDWATGTELGLVDGPPPDEPEEEEPRPPGDLTQSPPPLVWNSEPVPLAPVPEPPVWAMLLAGLVSCGWRILRPARNALR